MDNPSKWLVLEPKWFLLELSEGISADVASVADRYLGKPNFLTIFDFDLYILAVALKSNFGR